MKVNTKVVKTGGIIGMVLGALALVGGIILGKKNTADNVEYLDDSNSSDDGSYEELSETEE